MKILTNAFYETLENELNKSLVSLDENEVNNLEKSMIHEIIPDLVKSIKKTLLSDAQKMLEERRKLFSEFCKRNHKRWNIAFDLLETFIVICTEAGEEFNKSYRSTAVKENNLVFDIVVRHHARACHISQEILCLLKSGFADGAHARWRALHEVTVTAIFIAKHGQECAERFYWHDIVESYKGMIQHKEYEDRLNAKGNSEREILQCKKLYDEVIEKYGKTFKEPYGWASGFITNQYANFAEIEKDILLDHMRPYYKWASQNIHAGAKGINNKLGMCEATEDLLLVGQSNSGMTDPAHSSAISLAQITTTLLNIEPNIDRIVILKIILEMEKEIGEAFLKCDKYRET
ncbi:DUF5677 domain-containing protein [Aliarcobacter cryaerophilus]|uniref:DUF5677 domain-containing protein n=1 Tax=Aliarcobacter cryaerophilus TaxID=28198 RepID=UPI00082B80B5|nr:DUF5677 domain-containing protein [Aliarcobacter cryaerophilus]